MTRPAYFDTSTGKIMNCKKDTLIYFHEEGHKKWFNEGKEQIIELISFEGITVFVPIAIFFSTRNIFLTIISSLPLILLLLSEIHAWYYGIRKWLTKRKYGRKSYNPFKMGGSYAFALVFVLLNLAMLNFDFTLIKDYLYGIVIYPAIFGFLVGWGISSLLRSSK